MRNIIILVSGKSKSGKDVFGKVAEEELNGKVLVTNFAETYRQTLYSVGWDNDVKDDAYRFAMLSMGKLMSEYWESCFPAETVCDEILSNKLRADELDYGSNTNTFVTVVTDLRFMRELNHMEEFAEGRKSRELYTVRIHRPDFDNGMSEAVKNSCSECELDNAVFDYEITNKGSLEEYEKKVREVLRDILSN